MIASATDRIERLLDQEIAIARELAELLEDERAALTGLSAEAVASKAAEKAALLERFEALEEQRRTLCAEAGMPIENSAGALSGISATIAQRWRSLMGLIAACRDANETNGLIVNLRQGQIRQLIDIVRGEPSVTYDPHGRTFAKAARPLARA